MPGSFLRFDYKPLTLGRQLTDQQLWCLGCDVRERREALSELGWTYHPRPSKTKGCSRLTGMLPDGGHVSIWGFGFLTRDLTHGALWLGRHKFRPQRRADIDPSIPIYGVNELPRFTTPANADQADEVLFLLGQLAERLADHEDDTLSLQGTDYRRHCIGQWKCKKTAVDIEDVPRLWRQIACTIRDMLLTHTYTPGQKVPV